MRNDRDHLQAEYEALVEQLMNPPRPMSADLSRRLHAALYAVEDQLEELEPTVLPRAPVGRGYLVIPSALLIGALVLLFYWASR